MEPPEIETEKDLRLEVARLTEENARLRAVDFPARGEPTNCQQEPGYPGIDTVVFSLRDPNMVCHISTVLCGVEEPHAFDTCGVVMAGNKLRAAARGARPGERDPMSWQGGTLIVPKAEAESAILGIGFSGEMEAPAFDQVEAARRAALELLKSVPGPKVQVSIGGHANGTGWEKPQGMSSDFITVTVTQHV